MGQYFFFLNLDKKEFISPWDFDNGAKEMEHSYVGNDYVAACVKLIRNRWKGDRIVHMGDYADELNDNPKFKNLLKQIREENPLSFNKKESYYSLINDDNPNAFKKLMPNDIKGTDARYILVDDDKFIDRFNIKYGEHENDKYVFWRSKDSKTKEEYACLSKIDNFTLAIALGEGSGGSYYFEKGSEQEQLHGSLAGHRFDATNIKPKNRSEIDLSNFGYFTLEQVLGGKKPSDLELLLKDKFTLKILKDGEKEYIQSQFEIVSKEAQYNLDKIESTIKNICKGTSWDCNFGTNPESAHPHHACLTCNKYQEDVQEWIEFTEETKSIDVVKQIINICESYDVDKRFKLWYGFNYGEQQLHSPTKLLQDCKDLADDYVLLADNARNEFKKLEKSNLNREQDEGPEL